MEEIWKDIKGYEGIYQVSNLGRVKALEETWYSGRNGYIKKTKPEHIMKYRLAKNTGYCLLKLTKEGKEKHVLVHRLVAETFILNPNKLPEVNHIDGNKENNCVENLEWVTAKENISHATRNKLRVIDGCNNWRAKMSPEDILFIRANYKPRDKICGRNALAKKFKCSVTVISNIIARRTYKNF